MIMSTMIYGWMDGSHDGLHDKVVWNLMGFLHLWDIASSGRQAYGGGLELDGGRWLLCFVFVLFCFVLYICDIHRIRLG